MERGESLAPRHDIQQEVDRIFKESDAEVIRILSLYLHEVRQQTLEEERGNV